MIELFFWLLLFWESAAAKLSADYLIVGARIVSPSESAIAADAIVVLDGKIIDLGMAKELQGKYKPNKTIKADGGLLFPGFVNTHTHVTTVAMRGLTDSFEVSDWWMRLIWPTEKSFLKRDLARSLAACGIADQLRSGVTTINDMSFFSGAVAEAAEAMGIRARLSETLVSEDTPSYKDVKSALHLMEKQMAVFAKNRRISWAIAPHTVSNISPKDLKESLTWASQRNLPVHMHLAETVMDEQRSREWAGKKLFEYLEDVKLPRGAMLAHGVLLDEKQIRRFKQNGWSLSVNLTSNLNLAAGVPRLDLFKRFEVPLSIGTDGAVTNGASDFFEEMRVVLSTYRARFKDQPELTSKDIFAAATVGGAESLGINAGEIKVGALADFIIAQPPPERRIHILSAPEAVVKVLRSQDIKTVFVDGKVVIENSRFAPKIQKYLDAQVVRARGEVESIRDIYLEKKKSPVVN